MKNAVGILGGIGPLATVYFMQMIIEMTDADTDQEHINMLVSNHSTIPDRTEFILGRSGSSPAADMMEDALMLEKAGCSFIVIPCNTAHFFFKDIEQSVHIPVLNIIKETIDYAAASGSHVKKVGILATEGTIITDTYSLYGEAMGVECIAPDKEYQEKVNHIIYDKVKAGKPVTFEEIMEAVEHMRGKGCDAIVMGCTELSVAYKDLDLVNCCSDVVDSLTVLARRTVERAGKRLK